MGSDLLEDHCRRDGHRRSHVSCSHRLQGVRDARGRGYRSCDLADRDRAAHQGRRLGGNGDDSGLSGAGHTLRLAELRGRDGSTYGGKSATLGELIAGGIPVPPGFAVSTSAFRAFVEEAGLAGMIRSELARVSPDDIDSVGAASQAISEAMRFAPVPDAVRDEITRRYAELGHEAREAEAPVAVRSSALGED